MLSLLAMWRGSLRCVQRDRGFSTYCKASHRGATHAVPAAGPATRDGLAQAAEAGQQLQGVEEGDRAEGDAQVLYPIFVCFFP